jgi:hypothetical protein
MVINMNETKLCTIAQLQDFLKATPQVSFSGIGEKDDIERYAHISRVLKRFDYPHRKKPERGVVLALRQYLERTLCGLNAGSCVSTRHDQGGACRRPWQGPDKNRFKKTERQIHAVYTASFNPVSLYDDCGQTGFASGSYLNWKILLRRPVSSNVGQQISNGCCREQTESQPKEQNEIHHQEHQMGNVSVGRTDIHNVFWPVCT